MCRVCEEPCFRDGGEAHCPVSDAEFQEIMDGDEENDRIVADRHARGWRPLSCGCCAGLQWGGEEPRECRTCGGGGGLWLSPKNYLFQYPGGPAAGGKASAGEIASARGTSGEVPAASDPQDAAATARRNND